MSEKKETTTENQIPKKTTLYARPNGPLIVSGEDIELVNEEGKVIEKAMRFAICRCGHTGKQPFCDGSHNRMNFQG